MGVLADRTTGESAKDTLAKPIGGLTAGADRRVERGKGKE